MPLLAPAPAPEANDAALTIKVDSVDTGKRKLSGTDEYGTRFEFECRDDTMVQTASGSSIRLDAYLESETLLPFKIGQRVKISWRPNSDHKKRLATKVVVAQ